MIILVQGNGEAANSPRNGFGELVADLPPGIPVLRVACKQPGLPLSLIKPTNNRLYIGGFSFGGRVATQIVWDLLSPQGRAAFPLLQISCSLWDPVWWDPGHEIDEQTAQPLIEFSPNPRLVSVSCYLRTIFPDFFPFHSRLAPPYKSNNFAVPWTWHTTVLKQASVREAFLDQINSKVI